MAKRKRPTNTANETHRRPFELRTIKPLTLNQTEVFNSYQKGYDLVLHGVAGTGKTFISSYLALNDILNDNNTDYQKLYIIRSVVQSRAMGFLPGNPGQKGGPFEEPYMEIMDDLFGRGDGYDILKMKKIVEFRTTSFLRGVTFKNCVVLVDEIQNMTFQELDTIMTRVGEGCRIIFCGDFRQSDFDPNVTREKTGIHDFLNIIDRVGGFKHVEFGIEDIVRGPRVKSYIIAKHQLDIPS